MSLKSLAVIVLLSPMLLFAGCDADTADSTIEPADETFDPAYDDDGIDETPGTIE